MDLFRAILLRLSTLDRADAPLNKMVQTLLSVLTLTASTGRAFTMATEFMLEVVKDLDLETKAQIVSSMLALLNGLPKSLSSSDRNLVHSGLNLLNHLAEHTRRHLYLVKVIESIQSLSQVHWYLQGWADRLNCELEGIESFSKPKYSIHRPTGILNFLEQPPKDVATILPVSDQEGVRFFRYALRQRFPMERFRSILKSNFRDSKSTADFTARKRIWFAQAAVEYVTELAQLPTDPSIDASASNLTSLSGKWGQWILAADTIYALFMDFSIDFSEFVSRFLYKAQQIDYQEREKHLIQERTKALMLLNRSSIHTSPSSKQDTSNGAGPDLVPGSEVTPMDTDSALPSSSSTATSVRPSIHNPSTVSTVSSVATSPFPPPPSSEFGVKDSGFLWTLLQCFKLDHVSAHFFSLEKDLPPEGFPEPEMRGAKYCVDLISVFANFSSPIGQYGAETLQVAYTCFALKVLQLCKAEKNSQSSVVLHKKLVSVSEALKQYQHFLERFLKNPKYVDLSDEDLSRIGVSSITYSTSHTVQALWKSLNFYDPVELEVPGGARLARTLVPVSWQVLACLSKQAQRRLIDTVETELSKPNSTAPQPPAPNPNNPTVATAQHLLITVNGYLSPSTIETYCRLMLLSPLSLYSGKIQRFVRGEESSRWSRYVAVELISFRLFRMFKQKELLPSLQFDILAYFSTLTSADFYLFHISHNLSLKVSLSNYQSLVLSSIPSLLSSDTLSLALPLPPTVLSCLLSSISASLSICRHAQDFFQASLYMEQILSFAKALQPFISTAVYNALRSHTDLLSALPVVASENILSVALPSVENALSNDPAMSSLLNAQEPISTDISSFVETVKTNADLKKLLPCVVLLMELRSEMSSLNLSVLGSIQTGAYSPLEWQNALSAMVEFLSNELLSDPAVIDKFVNFCSRVCFAPSLCFPFTDVIALLADHVDKPGIVSILIRLLNCDPLRDRFNGFQSLGVSGEWWNEDNAFKKNCEYLKLYPEVSGTEIPPIYFSNMILRLNPVLNHLLNRVLLLSSSQVNLEPTLELFNAIIAAMRFTFPYHDFPIAYIKNVLLSYHATPILNRVDVRIKLVSLLGPVNGLFSPLYTLLFPDSQPSPTLDEAMLKRYLRELFLRLHGVSPMKALKEVREKFAPSDVFGEYSNLFDKCTALTILELLCLPVSTNQLTAAIISQLSLVDPDFSFDGLESACVCLAQLPAEYSTLLGSQVSSLLIQSSSQDPLSRVASRFIDSSVSSIRASMLTDNVTDRLLFILQGLISYAPIQHVAPCVLRTVELFAANNGPLNTEQEVILLKVLGVGLDALAKYTKHYVKVLQALGGFLLVNGPTAPSTYLKENILCLVQKSVSKMQPLSTKATAEVQQVLGEYSTVFKQVVM
eukprot:GILJ01012392.1.p1 GENE.GILJ01012392.1~~GILJ01012392.1.p1  ORF type:complete len:1391 (-),score=247.08 GILJ01012392.1:212-4384(-)